MFLISSVVYFIHYSPLVHFTAVAKLAVNIAVVVQALSQLPSLIVLGLFFSRGGYCFVRFFFLYSFFFFFPFFVIFCHVCISTRLWRPGTLSNKRWLQWNLKVEQNGRHTTKTGIGKKEKKGRK